VIDQDHRAFVSLNEIVDFSEPRWAPGIHYYRVLDRLRTSTAQPGLGVAEFGLGEESADSHLLGTGEEDLRTGKEPHRAHRSSECVEVRRKMGRDDPHAPIVLKLRRQYGYTAIRLYGFPHPLN